MKMEERKEKVFTFRKVSMRGGKDTIKSLFCCCRVYDRGYSYTKKQEACGEAVHCTIVAVAVQYRYSGDKNIFWLNGVP